MIRRIRTSFLEQFPVLERLTSVVSETTVEEHPVQPGRLPRQGLVRIRSVARRFHFSFLTVELPL